jgi:hypothetical protein
MFSFFRRFYLLFVILFILGAGGYIAFKEFWYFGTARFYLSDFPAIIQVEGEGEFMCSSSSCDFVFPPGNYRANAVKKGYEEIFFEIAIFREKVTEKKLGFLKKSLQLQIVPKTAFPPLESKKIFLPKEKSEISEKISDFSLTDEGVFWQTNFLFSPSSPTVIASDEVGRGVLFVSENEIKKFEKKTQTLSTVLKKNIRAFEPFVTHQSLYIDNEGKYFFIRENGISYEMKNISPLSFRTICIPKKDSPFI